MPDNADRLIAEIASTQCWPLKRERHILEKIHVRRAFRKGEKRILKDLANWDVRCRELFVGDIEREYILDPLAKRIAGAWADFLFGDEPTVTAHNETDQPWVDLAIEENRLASRLHRAETVVASEGEAWWHIWTDRTAAITPLLEFVSRLCVVPLWRGDRLLAVAFVTCVAEEDTDVWRHIEVHADRRVVNTLFKGAPNDIGLRVQLTERPETADIEEVWAHGLPMLAGRVVNDLDDDPTLGIGEYDQIQDLLLALNEARTIGAENTRLTAKKRLFVNGALTAPDGSFDAGQDVIQVDSKGAVLGDGDGKPPVSEVEYSYDAAPLIAHNQDLEQTILSRVGLVPQMVGRAVDGAAESGTAIRLRFLPTEIAADGKAREWGDLMPRILQLMMLVDGLTEAQGGFSRSYAESRGMPTFELGSILPVDEKETLESNAVAVTAAIRSRETAVREQHPEWTEADIQDELARIKDDEQLAAPAPADTPMLDHQPPMPADTMPANQPPAGSGY